MSAAARRVRLWRLGRTPYEEALELQSRVAAGRAEGREPDTLILLEHPPVITLGRNATRENVLFDQAQLASRGVSLVRCDRGGDATFHGPGQLVAYPILDLRPDRCRVRRYVSDLEELMIRCCRDFGLEAGRKEGMAGAWLGGPDGEGPWRKIGAVGVHVRRWITSHGLALNVTTDLSYYGLINPCGITEHPVTSMAEELSGDRRPASGEVAERLTVHFADVFGALVEESSDAPLSS